MSVISQFSSGGVKSVQSGVKPSAGSITINAVNVAKSVVTSVSKGSAGTVAATGTIGRSNINLLISAANASGYSLRADFPTGWESFIGYNDATTITGGTTNLTTNQYSARITSSTSLLADGPCEWQVVEYY